MLLFQHPDDFIWASRDHQEARSALVKEPFPTTASSTCFTEVSCWAPIMEYSQPPNQPSETPPAMGVIPAAFSVLQAAMSWFQVVGTAMWCCRQDVLPVQQRERRLQVPRGGPHVPLVGVLPVGVQVVVQFRGGDVVRHRAMLPAQPGSWE